ncbi:MAG: hypothetical protein DMENIID0002_01550 [Rickettsia endosymbiont of Sergentomyia squamirostris]|uniref:Pilus formation protein N-terminal domain-containing protein n=1 Tax=Candidatus Tisiphia endosymbiont of Sergentomyia squamirostris TaxID=3113639 RepID=A0AAT9G6S3_9RICK
MKKLQKLYLTVMLMLSLFASEARAIGYPIIEDAILELQIAKSGPTRITIVGEKILDIFVHPQEAVEAVIHSSGCLVVLPQAGADGVFITIFGDNETVQDLSLRFTKKSPSPVRLIKFNLDNELSNTKERINNEKKLPNNQ